MNDKVKSKEQLLNELVELRQRISEFKQLEIEHKRAMEALRESQELYRTFIDATSDVVFLKDEHFRHLIVNKACRESFDREEDDILGKTAFDLLPEDFAQGCQQTDSEARESGGLVVSEEHEGNRVYETRKFPVRLRDGKVGVGGYVRDITERKLAEEELKKNRDQLENMVAERTAELTKINKKLEQEIIERKQVEEALRTSEERFKETVDLLPTIVVEYDLEGLITYVNDYGYEMLGYSPADAEKGFRIPWLLPPGEIEKHMDRLDRLIKGEKIPGSEYQLFKKDGSVVHALINSAPIYRDGKVVGIRSTATDITERKRAEDALRQSEERYRTIVETQMELVCRFLPDGTLTFVNEAICQLLGQEREQIIGQNFYTYVHPDDQEKTRNNINALSRENPLGMNEERVILPTGEMRWWQWSNRALFDGESKVTEFQAVGRDITDRVETEQKLQDSEERHRLLLESSPDPIVVYDMEGRATYINPAFESTFGWSSDELLGKHIDFVPQENWPETRDAIDRMKRGESILSFETRRLTKDFGILDIQLSSSLFKDRHGNPAGNIVILRDISERKQAEEALLKSENYFRSLLYQLYEDVLVIDRDYKVTDVNKSFLTTAGRAREDIIGHRCYEISHGYNEPCDMKGEECPLLKVFETGKPCNCRHRHTRADGSKTWVDIFLSPLRDQNGDITHVIEGIRDVTDFINMEEDLRASEEKFRALFDHIPTMAFVVDRDHHLIATNWAFSQKMGEQSGKSTLELTGISPSIKEFWHTVEKQVIESGEPTWYAEVVNSPERGQIYIETRKQPIRDKAGKVSMVVGVATDITDYVKQQIALTAQLKELRVKISRETGPTIIGKSKKISEALGRVEAIAGTDTTVLITGESGSGKELVAEAIHNLSKRSEKPLIKVNCAALPESIIESELFGHTKGAFTGAVSNRIGRFEAAHGGTIFLDEIGDISPGVQVRLLRVLEERKVERVGDYRPINVDVRIIAATNQNLRSLVEKGRFREDLFYRLNVFNIHMPPLRERAEDIPLLVAHFIRECSREMGKEISSVSDEAMHSLLQHNWRGNVRELMNVVESASVLCAGKTIETEHLPPILESWTTTSMEASSDKDIREALRLTRGNKARAARLLGIHRSTLYRRMERYGIATE
jgi:PAS domain S-box-containing protein